jgi:outer membrane protein assembly factor BamB
MKITCDMKCIFSQLLILVFFVASGQPTVSKIISPPKDLIPEGISIDKRTGVVYVTSIDKHKIIAIDKKGRVRDFIKQDQDGFMEGLGVKVDQQRRWLWAASVLREGKLFHSAIHAFDLKSGKTMQQHRLKDTVPHLFNDIAIAEDGTLLITDTYFSAIFQLDPQTMKLDLLSRGGLIRWPNGLAFGNGKLYLATYGSGLVMFDTTTKTATKLSGVADTVIAKGLDGLVYTKNKLFGIYNLGSDQTKNCVIEYTLSADGNHIERERIIDRGNLAFADPTTAALYRNKLYVIANSHLDIFNANKTSTKGIEEKLMPLTILIY